MLFAGTDACFLCIGIYSRVGNSLPGQYLREGGLKGNLPFYIAPSLVCLKLIAMA